MLFKSIAVISLAASAQAFAPASFGTRSSMSLFAASDFVYGEYDDKLWSNDNKIKVYEKWDPLQPRDGQNFNPFETFSGNSPDASGVFPGEAFYKDPQRGEISFAIMMEERASAEERAASPKTGDAPGAPGCKNGKPKN